MAASDQIVHFQDSISSLQLDVRVEDDTVWLNQSQIVELFESSKGNVSQHIKNIFATNELQENSTVRKIRTVQYEGQRLINREVVHYNLDVIISVGYRINSIRGTQFRIWANQILKEYLLKGYAVDQRIDRIEKRIQYNEGQLEKLVRQSLPVREGVFYEGEIFDAYVFVAGIVREAKSSIWLIDNYIDEGVLMLLSKRKAGVEAKIFTQSINAQLRQDIERHNAQYPAIEVVEFGKSHDRFLIVDQKRVYHIGASLKDLGRRWFAFSRIEDQSIIDCLIEKITNKNK